MHIVTLKDKPSQTSDMDSLKTFLRSFHCCTHLTSRGAAAEEQLWELNWSCWFAHCLLLMACSPLIVYAEYAAFGSLHWKVNKKLQTISVYSVLEVYTMQSWISSQYSVLHMMVLLPNVHIHGIKFVWKNLYSKSWANYTCPTSFLL